MLRSTGRVQSSLCLCNHTAPRGDATPLTGKCVPAPSITTSRKQHHHTSSREQVVERNLEMAKDIVMTRRRCRNMEPEAPHEVKGAADGSGFIGKEVHASMLVRVVSTTSTVRHIPRYDCITVSWGQLNGSQGTPLIGQPLYFAIAGTTQHDLVSRGVEDAVRGTPTIVRRVPSVPYNHGILCATGSASESGPDAT
jgi:hypothetical protein